MGDDNDDKKTRQDDQLRKVGFGWHDRFGIHLTGLSERDVSRIAIAIAFAIVLLALAVAFSLVWDRVSSLWG